MVKALLFNNVHCYFFPWWKSPNCRDQDSEYKHTTPYAENQHGIETLHNAFWLSYKSESTCRFIQHHIIGTTQFTIVASTILLDLHTERFSVDNLIINDGEIGCREVTLQQLLELQWYRRVITKFYWYVLFGLSDSIFSLEVEEPSRTLHGWHLRCKLGSLTRFPYILYIYTKMYTSCLR